LEEVDGYEIIIKNKCCSIFYNAIFYAYCPLVNGLYVLDLENKSIYNINMKRARLNDLNPTFILHCRLGHINEKRTKRLHKDGLLDSFDFESFNTCKSCLLRKMTKAPFTSQSEKVSDLYIMMSFWGYALETATFTLNSVSTKSVERTPYEIWTGKRLGLFFPKVWGCEAYVKRLILDKLTLKLDKCFFVGYPRETKGYYFYNKVEGKVFVARNCVFLEKEFISK
jgi:hypothetical protein